MLSKKKVERLNKRTRRRVQRFKRRRDRRTYHRARRLWTIDYRCIDCHSQRKWCPCGSLTKELLIREATADTPECKDVQRRRYPNPNPHMVPYDVVSRATFYTRVSLDAEFSDSLVAKLRAAGFIRRKRHCSSKVYKKWKKRLARRAAYFATEEGKAQTMTVIAEAMLSK